MLWYRKVNTMMMETLVYRNNAQKASVSAGLEAPEAAVATATLGTHLEGELELRKKRKLPSPPLPAPTLDPLGRFP